MTTGIMTPEEVRNERFDQREQFTFLRRGGQVKRWHTWPTLRVQTVGEHSHAVGCLLAHLTTPEQVSKNLLMAAMYHDLSEYFTGDIPSTAKWADVEFKEAAHRVSDSIEKRLGLRVELTDEEARLLVWCDLCELVLFALEEWYMGNHNMQRVVNVCLNKLMTMGPPTTKAAVLHTRMQDTFIKFKRGDFDMSSLFTINHL